MTLHQLDFWFPFFVFGYGAVMTFTLNQPTLARLAETRLSPELRTQIRAHRGLALLSLVIGSVWSLQNMWLA